MCSEWKSMDSAPKDGTPIYMRTFGVYRFTPYNPHSQQFKQGLKGRWQEMDEYGDWNNCSQPLGNEWRPDSPLASPEKGDA